MTSSKKKKKPQKSPPPRPSPWKAPPAFTRPSADDRLLEMFHHITSVRTDVSLLHMRLERTDERIRALALLVEAREVLRAIVKHGMPAVPSPRPDTQVSALFPLELLLAAGELLPLMNELLKGAQR